LCFLHIKDTLNGKYINFNEVIQVKFENYLICDASVEMSKIMQEKESVSFIK